MPETQTDFDLTKAMVLAQDYANATGMECLVLKSDGDGVLRPCTAYGHDVLCYQKDGAIGKGCIETHLYGAAQSKNTQQVFTYFCPIGLIHWAVPIVKKGTIQGALIGGHAFLQKARTEIAQLKSLSEEHTKLLKKYPELKNSLLSSPAINKERLESLKNILSLIAASLSDTEQGTLELKARWDTLLGKDSPLLSAKHQQNKKWQHITDQLTNGKILEKETALQKILDDIREKAEPLETTKNRLSFLLLSICEAKEEDGVDYYLSEMALNAISLLEPIRDTKQLLAWTEKHVRRILESCNYLPKIKHADMVYKALLYIEENYMRHIGLQDIAAHVHFSPPYFSKVFKQELRMTFIQYLTKVRIEESKKLLEDKSIPLSDIPALVGFEEQSYFSKVFRVATGISPGRYRESVS